MKTQNSYLGYVYTETILKRKRKSGVVLLLFILRCLDQRFGWEIRVHMVTQKCVKFNLVCTPGARWQCGALPHNNNTLHGNATVEGF